VESRSYVEVYYCGMDYSTMTAFSLEFRGRTGLTTDKEVNIHCQNVKHSLETSEKLSGKAHLRFYGDRCELSAECYTKTGDLWVFKSSNVETKKEYYPQKEAGFRAKFFIGQPKSKYEPQDIITFAILGYPYIYSDCKDFFASWFPDAPGPEPGAIMVERYGKHCAILDDEGTKFIHMNPVSGKVTYDSIVIAERYFPEGIYYLRLPDE